MARYVFDGDNVVLYLTHDDIALLGSLVDQLSELLGEGMEPEPAAEDDPFAAWEADLAESPDAPEPFDDPALQRLFPNPYPHDPAAASDYRRYTERDHRRSKLTGARLVRADIGKHPPITIPADHLDPWLKTLNALRLVLASRLGVDDEDSMDELHDLADDDPRAMLGSVMDWLAGLQVVLIEMIGDLDPLGDDFDDEFADDLDDDFEESEGEDFVAGDPDEGDDDGPGWSLGWGRGPGSR